MLNRLALGALLAAGAIPAQAQMPKPNAEINRAWAAGYRAGFVCSSLWNGAGKPLAAIERDELTGIYPEIEADVRTLTADVDDKARRVVVRYRDDMPPRIAEWRSRDGCVTYPIGATPPVAATSGQGVRCSTTSRGRWATKTLACRHRTPCRH